MSLDGNPSQSPFLNEESFVGEPVNDDFGRRAAALASESAFAGALESIEEEVLGIDERTLVTDTFQIPNRWICAIDVLKEDERGVLSVEGRGTGILIGPRHVLTAKHVLKNFVRVRVSPARHLNNMSHPLGQASNKAIFRSKPEWIGQNRRLPDGSVSQRTRRNDDVAMIILDKEMSGRTHKNMKGPLGYWGQTPSQAAVRAFSPATVQDRDVTIIGYPGDRCGTKVLTGSGSNEEDRIKNKKYLIDKCAKDSSDIWASTQWQSFGKLDADPETSRLQHTADTYGGESGAPIFLRNGDSLDLLGVHTAPGDGTSPTSNVGVRVTLKLMQEIASWMNTDARYRIATIQNDTLIVQPRPKSAHETLASFEEAEEAPPQEFEVPIPSKDVSDALAAGKPAVALQLAIQQGIRSEVELTNLLFFDRHRDLGGRALDPDNNTEDKKLGAEWGRILQREVRPAIRKASVNVSLNVSGDYVAERDAQFSGATGEKMRALVEWAAKEADINPGLLAAVSLAEFDKASLYLSPGEVRSFVSGTDDFFAGRQQLRKNVPAFSKVGFDEKKKTTNTNEHGRIVTTIPFNSGKDAMLATAVYLKYAEIKLRKAAKQNGGDFDTLPVETRFALVRIAMAAGHGGISPDGEFIRFKKVKDKWARAKQGDKAGKLFGVASRLERVLKGEDILVRKDESRKYPSTGHITNRNATILAAQALHLDEWFFGVAAAPPVPEPETDEFEEDLDLELSDEAESPYYETEDEDPSVEMLVATVAQSDLRTRLDEYFDLANVVYDLPGGTAVARPQFRYAKKGGVEAAAKRVRRILGDAFEKSHPRAIHMAANGKAKPSEIAAITQALIDAGELAAVSAANPGLSNKQLVRALQSEFKMGLDCLCYVQLAFIHAYTGSDNDPPSVRQRLGLHVSRGWETLADLKGRHFTKVKLADAQTGDLFIMKPQARSEDGSWHSVIIVDHTVAATVHTFLCDSSWGTSLYGPDAGGVARRELKHDTSTGEWWDVPPPLSGTNDHRNPTGPYNGHPIHGIFRANAKK